MVSVKFSLSSLLSATFLAAATLLGGCGGGGAQDPYSTVTYPALVVNPAALNVYAGTPAVVTISSGVAPFQVFTSDAVVLPVVQVVSGAAITLTASSIASETEVRLTIRDAVGQAAAVTVIVKPSPLIGALSIVPTSNTACSGEVSSSAAKAAVCTGDSAVASVSLKSNATSVLPNRQVRFDVIQGAYNFVIDQAGTIVNKTITVLTDQNGKADAVIRTDASAPSQVGLIRATDVTSGNRVDSSFTIVQAINGSAVLSILPSAYSAAGKYKGECPNTSGDFLVYGGTPPYSVRSSLPNAIALSVGGVTSDPVVVSRSGGSFTASSFASASCGDYSASIVITDATGRIANVTYSVKAGTEERVVPALTLSPSGVTLGASAGSCTQSVKFIVVGGSGSGSYSTSIGSVTAAGLWVGPLPVGTTATVTYVDAAAGKLVSADIVCAAPTP